MTRAKCPLCHDSNFILIGSLAKHIKEKHIPKIGSEISDSANPLVEIDVESQFEDINFDYPPDANEPEFPPHNPNEITQNQEPEISNYN